MFCWMERRYQWNFPFHICSWVRSEWSFFPYHRPWLWHNGMPVIAAGSCRTMPRDCRHPLTCVPPLLFQTGTWSPSSTAPIWRSPFSAAAFWRSRCSWMAGPDPWRDNRWARVGGTADGTPRYGETGIIIFMDYNDELHKLYVEILTTYNFFSLNEFIKEWNDCITVNKWFKSLRGYLNDVDYEMDGWVG